MSPSGVHVACVFVSRAGRLAGSSPPSLSVSLSGCLDAERNGQRHVRRHHHLPAVLSASTLHRRSIQDFRKKEEKEKEKRLRTETKEKETKIRRRCRSGRESRVDVGFNPIRRPTNPSVENDERNKDTQRTKQQRMHDDLLRSAQPPPL